MADALPGYTTEVSAATLLRSLAPELSFEALGAGGFLVARLPHPAARARLRLGRAAGMTRFMACYRYEPFWMKPCVGVSVSSVPIDTQFLLLELGAGQHALIAPLVQAPFKASLHGEEGELWLVLDSGDPETTGVEAVVAYLAVGSDPYELCRQGARACAERLQTVRPRREKPLPALADYFGWCTWDAFYQEVSHDKVREGLESFRQGGVEPRLLILDDGWQTVHSAGQGAARLSGFGANEKFATGLGATVRLAKDEFGIQSFVVWHAVHGYWGGVDAEALPGYGVSSALRNYSPEVLGHLSTANDSHWGTSVGRPSCAGLLAFYDDYHRYLAEQGVDGVKVDNQASVEGLGHGQGGRVGYMRATRDALEASARRHLHGELINCMSCSSEMFYLARDSSLTRTSTDFWPNIPASHGLHVYTNAMVGLWFGELVHPDWDMFQSGHAAGAFHAAARAVSGSPIYVSDKPGQHDFELLRQLVLSDGRALRARDVGVPTPDSLYADPTSEARLFKVFNRNRSGWVIGVFNARHIDGDNRISGSITPSDVPEATGQEFALYLKRADRLLRVGRDQPTAIELDSLGAEVATLVALDRGLAALGLSNKLSSGAAVLSAAWRGNSYVVELADGGDALLFSEQRPARVEVDGVEAESEWHDGRLTLHVAGGGRHELRVTLDEPSLA
jgi:raffinose synthase